MIYPSVTSVLLISLGVSLSFKLVVLYLWFFPFLGADVLSVLNLSCQVTV